MIKQILTAVNYCHFRGVFHRDLKPANILISQQNDKNYIKIADFGIAKQIYHSPQQHTEVVSSPFYRAPEVILGGCTYSK